MSTVSDNQSAAAERRKREKELEKTRAARAYRDRQSSYKRTPVGGRARAAASALKSSHLSPPPQSSEVELELEALRERKLASQFRQHFAVVIENLARERAAAEAALTEFERKKAENAAVYAARGEIPPTHIWNPIEKVYLELKRRNEEIRRKEMETQEIYHRYCKYLSREGGLDGSKELPPLPKEMVKQVDVLTKNMEEQQNQMKRSKSKNDVRDVVQKLETPVKKGSVTPPPPKRKPHRSTWSPTPLRQMAVMQQLEEEKELREEERTLLEKARVKAEAAEQDAVLEESALQANLAEKNAKRLQMAMTWLRGSPVLDVPPSPSPSFTEDESLAEDDDYVVTSLADFLLQEANKNLAEEDEASQTSASLQQDLHAVVAAEKAAKDMADAVSLTSSITNDFSPASKDKWYAYWSEEHQREYYYQPGSGKITWTPPDHFSVSSSFRKQEDGESISRTDSAPNLAPVSEATPASVDGYSANSHPTYEWSERDFVPEDKKMMLLRAKASAARKARNRHKRFVRRCIWSAVAVATLSGGSYVIYQKQFAALQEGVAVLPASLQQVWDEAETRVQQVWDVLSSSELETGTKVQRVWEVLSMDEQNETDGDANALVANKWGTEIGDVHEIALRPFRCNIPLFYLFSSKCRRIAVENPIFNLADLVNSMMQ